MSLSKSGIALVTVVIFVILISIIAIAAINLMAGQALLIEHQIKRIQAYYLTEAAIQKNLLHLFNGAPIEPTTTIDTNSVSVSLQHTASEPVGTSTLKAAFTY